MSAKSRVWSVGLIVFALLGACGKSDDDSSDDGTPSKATDAGDASDTTDIPCDYEMQEVPLTADLVIPAGKTVHVCAGVTFKTATNKKIDVLGELIVDGTAAKPVSFIGATGTTPRSWHGLVIEDGGTLRMTHGKISAAIYGLFAMPGSSFDIDRSHFDTSFKTAVLQADGKITNSQFVASSPPTIAITDSVTVDDPNGTLTIMTLRPPSRTASSTARRSSPI